MPQKVIETPVQRPVAPPPPKILPVTEYILPNEKAYVLAEVTATPYRMSRAGRRFVPDDWSGLHRWQLVWVNRGDALAMHIEDLGLASAFKAGAFQIIAVWEHTVAECRDMAATQRGLDGADMADFLAHRQGESTLISDFLRAKEEGAKAYLNQTFSAPGLFKQRNTFLKRRRRIG